MKPGSTGPQIELLHRRLEISGDLVGQSIPNEYDAAVVAAVKKFQARHGLPPTGVIDNRVTVEALNIPATVRLTQLKANLSRLQSLAPSAANLCRGEYSGRSGRSCERRPGRLSPCRRRRQTGAPDA